MKNNTALKFYAKNGDEFVVTSNFGWSIKLQNSLPVLFFNNEQLWSISPTNFPTAVSFAGIPTVFVHGYFFQGNITFDYEQTAYDTVSFTTISNSLLNQSFEAVLPVGDITLQENQSGTGVRIEISKPTQNVIKYNTLTVNTGYNSDEHYGVICKLYNKNTGELVESKPQSKDAQATFNNLAEKTDYVVIITYVCNETNSNYNYDNFVEVTTLPKAMKVYGNDNSFKAGELYASPNKDGIFKEATALYCRDVNNNWKKME